MTQQSQCQGLCQVIERLRDYERFSLVGDIVVISQENDAVVLHVKMNYIYALEVRGGAVFLILRIPMSILGMSKVDEYVTLSIGPQGLEVVTDLTKRFTDDSVKLRFHSLSYIGDVLHIRFVP